jgi:WD40 repeat protein
MALSDDGKKLAVGGSDGSVYCWRAADWSQGTAYRLHTGGVTALAFASQDDLLATAGDDRIKLWHADDGHVDQVLHASEGGSIFALAFTPDGRTLASSHGSDQSVRFWNLDTQCLQHCQRDTLGHVRALAFSRDGGFLAIAAGLWKEPGDVSLRPMRPGASRMTLRGHSNVAYCVAFSPDGRLLATGSGDETVRIWETATGKEIMTLQP